MGRDEDKVNYLPVIVVVIVILAVVGVYFALKSEEGAGNGATSAEFEVSNLTIDPREVEVGNPVVISATVKNVGDVEGTHTMELKIDGVTEATEDVTLAGGATEIVSFTLIKNTAKTYNGSVNGLIGTFMVFEQPTLEVSYDKEYYYQEETAHDTIRMTGVVHDGEMDVTVYYALYNPRGEQILEDPTGTVHHLQETGMTEPVEYTCHITILDTYLPGTYTEEVRVVDHLSGQEATGTTTFLVPNEQLICVYAHYAVMSSPNLPYYPDKGRKFVRVNAEIRRYGDKDTAILSNPENIFLIDSKGVEHLSEIRVENSCMGEGQSMRQVHKTIYEDYSMEYWDFWFQILEDKEASEFIYYGEVVQRVTFGFISTRTY